jgi:hypothetical protein
MRVAALSSLIGLCFDLAGAFLLAAEAIGLETIRSWKESVLDRPTYILGTPKTPEIAQRAEEHRLRWLPGAAIGLASGIGSAMGTFVALSIKQLGLPSWLPFLGLVLGGIAGAFVIDGIVFLLRSASSFLLWVQESAGRGTIGLTGFVLLAIGFVLQFIGSLSQMLVP